ncbi:ergot alkaloid biosynthetic protein a [Moniliophthora roreri MCA 2997]|uniref:Ergot alkaloid biosynthetic protein a n=2 Tax=Moniliophthora roreri TaxID=221103 RepID=V2YCZ2_MONRO|nr:ergot alkaloid biosynthetic protein a [Moniliophthora roreri MCA 2997]KAI3602204.1 ergot alkaloid biosynthetic protein a [Moniliophthora roreri]
MSQTILLVGGTGTTATPLVKQLLSTTNATLILTSRKGASGIPSSVVECASQNSASDRLKAVLFDWGNSKTWGNPFTVTETVDAMYLIHPVYSTVVQDPNSVLNQAVKRGIRRVVLMSATVCEKGGYATGKTHKYLEELRDQGKLKEFSVVRPSWFYTNLTAGYDSYIRDQDMLVSAAEDGKLGWVGPEDIADAVYDALVVPGEELCEDYIITGPELLSYDDVTTLLTETLSRKITHRRISASDFGSSDYSKMMGDLDRQIAGGLEERIFALKDVAPKNGKGGLKRWVGTRPLKEYIEANKECWKRG